MDNNYKYSEIILALREEYRKYEKLLKRLEKLLVVRNYDVNIKATIGPDYTEKEINNIRIDIYEKQSNIKRILHVIKLTMMGVHTLGEPHRIVTKDDDTYLLIIDNSISSNLYNLDPKFHPEFIDKKAFDETADEIMNSDFIKLPGYFESLDRVQSLTMSTGGISLSENYGYNANTFSYVGYNPKNDSLDSIISNGEKSILIRLLDTRIPKDYIPNEYRVIIEKSLKENKKFSNDVDVDSPINRRCELEIIEKPYNYGLVRKNRFKNQ